MEPTRPAGVILLDKPPGITSFSAVNRVRRALNLKKAGHTGTLDPMATGVLVIMTEGATKFINFLPDHAKAYRAGFRLGIVTDTLDMTGTILEERSVHVSTGDIAQALTQFRGKIMQTPPMVSAIQRDGVRLYELARQGIEIEREAREVYISKLELTMNDEQFTIEVECSSGTYIRSLIDDLGRVLGCGACMTSLRRTMACGYGIEQCVTLEQLAAGEFSPIAIGHALQCYPKVDITVPQAVRFRNGGALDCNRLKFSNMPQKGQLLRVYGDDFLGLGKISGEQLNIARLLV